VRLLATSEQTDAAVATLDEFLAQEPHDQELQLLRAQLHLDAQEYDAALALFDDILAHGPGQPDVLLTAAMVALEVDALDKARDYLTALRATGARPGEAAFLLGQVEEKAGNLDEALEWYDKVDGENETNARVQSAGILAEQGEMGRAREILHQLRASFPSDSPALYLIEGELLREHAREQEAVDVYTEALAEMPDNADLLYARAMVEVGMDRVDLLERDLRRILVDDPDHVDALNALGYTLADRTDRLAEAKSLIERAYQLRPEEPAILDSMGWVLFRSGDAQSAEPYLRKALAATFDPEIAAHLGEVLWALGRKAEARQVWDRALAEDPEHEYLLRTLGRYRFSQTTQ
jgi:tetratricopeptide (TPR) repeat protein